MAAAANTPSSCSEPRRASLKARPCHRDANDHVEQKNCTHVRQLSDYDRLENSELCEAINALYRDLWEPLRTAGGANLRDVTG